MDNNQPILSYHERLKLIKLGQLPKEAVAKKKVPMKKVSDKRAAEIKTAKELGVDGVLDLFFDEMIKRCTGKCLFCNSPTNDIKLFKIENEKWSQEANEKAWQRDIEKMKRIAIAHLLPKRPIEKGGFPSVATNENNWIELCWSCHTSFDSGKISWMMLKDSKEWDIIKEKLLLVLPAVSMEERKHKLYDRLTQLVYSK